MKITFICNEYPPRPHGGIGTFVQTVARALASRGHAVRVVGLGDTAEETSDGSIKVTTLRSSGIRFIGNLISRLRLRNWLAKEAKKGGIDIIEVPDYLGLLPFRVRGCPAVVRLHISTTAIYREAGLKIPKGISFYERRTLSCNPQWIGVSQYILDSTKEIFGFKPSREAKIYNPVSTVPLEISGIGEMPEKFILYAGQVSRRKGALVLAEAAKELLRERSDLHLIYVGGEIVQPGVRSIKDQTQEMLGPSLMERVHFLGWMERGKVLSYMKKATVFAFPSKLEALGLVVLEAMQCGTPVVCTSAPPGPEIVEDNVTGLLADPNSPRDFLEKMRRIVDDSVLAARLSENAMRHVVEKFSLEKCVGQTEAFYRECLGDLSLGAE
jgi:glycosyltransferase involved in cell wall biosynthesis